MPEALRQWWTPESRVYKSSIGTFRLLPQLKAVDSGGMMWDTGQSVELCEKWGDTLLPNRTVTTESILGTASAAKAVEQGVADAVEGRTVEVSVTKTKHEALYDAARRYVESGRYEPDSKIQQDLAEAVRQLTPHRADQAKIPDPLDQLAAEAQAEGEYEPSKFTAWHRFGFSAGGWGSGSIVGPELIADFNDFVEVECERAVERGRKAACESIGRTLNAEVSIKPDGGCVIDYKASPRLSEQLDRLAQTEQFKNCQFDGVDPATLSTPRRTAREVAEQCVIVIENRVTDRMSQLMIDTIRRAITAAIELDREGR